MARFGNRLNVGREGEGGVRNEAKAVGLMGWRVMRLAETENVQGEEGLSGNKGNLFWDVFSFRQRWPTQTEMSEKQSEIWDWMTRERCGVEKESCASLA